MMTETLLEKLDRIESELKKIQSIKPTKQIDHSKELSLINNEINAIKQSINKKQDIDIKSEIEKHVNEKFVTNLYRNK